MSYSHDPRHPIMVNAAAYRRAMEAKPTTAGDTLHDVLAGVALFAFLAAVGFWATL